MQRQIEAPGLVQPTSSTASFFELASRPAALGATLLACIIGAAGASVVAIPMLVSIAGVTLLSATRPAVQARLASERRRRMIQRHRDDRETRLEEANVRRDRLAALTRIADEIAAWDARATDNLQLEALLDRYADVETALARCRQVRIRSDAEWLHPRDRAALVHCYQPGSSRDLCVALEEDLAAIEDLFVRLAERTARQACEGLVHDVDVDVDIDDR